MTRFAWYLLDQPILIAAAISKTVYTSKKCIRLYLISDGIKDIGYLICYYKCIRISDMKHFLYFYRLKILDDSSIALMTSLLQKLYEDATHD